MRLHSFFLFVIFILFLTNPNNASSQSKGYKITNIQQTAYGLEADLQLVQGTAQYGTDITPLHMSVYMETENRLHVKIVDPSDSRWTVPYVTKTVLPTNKPSRSNYIFSYTTNPFGLAVQRASNGEVLFNTTVPNPSQSSFAGLIFEDQYIELSTQIPNKANLYGFGEQIRPLKLKPGMYTLWAEDIGTPNNTNLYGSHPFYLDVRSSGLSHGVFMLNSNGMDIVVADDSISYRMIGGVIDLYFFMGSKPDEVITQYLEVVGRPYLVPYWSLGFHQCRYGYKNLIEVKSVVENYRSHKIPMETIWTDIDYMDAYEDFSFDPVRYPPDQMKQFVDQLHAQNQHYVLITDPGIHNREGYKPYERGLALEIFIKDSSGKPFIGKVWPGTTAFPDFWNPESFQYWYENVRDFHKVAAFDGMWIDMNEISNFCSGECSGDLDNENKPPSSSFNPNNPPYAINNGNNKNPLSWHTLSMDAVHYNSYIEYNVHNMYGFMEMWATHNALERVRHKRALVISRSTFPGSGVYGGHWTGDTTSRWSDLYFTIPDMLNFNLFGIPMIGADICGFGGNTTEELCARWIQLGAFYPFSRNHNAINSISQELYLWPLVANVSREVLSIRYSLLPYYYTLFYNVHVGNEGTVVRPLFFEFPSDSNTWDIDQQFLIGSGILITPVVTQGATSVRGYFPRATWYDYYTLKKVQYSGSYAELSSPITFIPIHLRGGVIIPTQQPSYTTTESRKNPFTLLVPLDEATGVASGSLYVDDGDTINSTERGLFTLIQFSASYHNQLGKFSSSASNLGFNQPNLMTLKSIFFMGINNPVTKVILNGNTISSFKFDASSSTLQVTNINLPFNVAMSLSFQ